MSGNTFNLGPTPDTVRSADGRVPAVPEGWILLSPGDAALTRRVEAAGDPWVVAEKKGRKVFSRGVWAAAATIQRNRVDLDGERSTEGFAKKKEADARRRDKAQADYVEDFFGAVVAFLQITLIQPSAWHGPSPTTQRRSAAARSPGPGASRSCNEPRLRLSPGCSTKRLGTTAWRSHG